MFQLLRSIPKTCSAVTLLSCIAHPALAAEDSMTDPADPQTTSDTKGAPASAASSPDSPATQTVPDGAMILDTIRVVDQTQTDDTQTVTSEDIDQVGASTLSDIFRNTPDVSVSGGSQAAAQRIYVHGLDDSSLNVTIDGARQGAGFYRHQGNLNIDPDLLKKADVDAGTGNALSGPGALGGAIRFVTKDAEDLLLPGQKNGAMLKSSLHSNDQTVMGAAALYGRPIDEVSYLLYSVKSWSDDYDAGGGETMAQTGSEPFSGLAKLAVRPAPGHEVKLTVDYRENNGTRTRRPNFMIDPVDIAQEQEFIRKTHTLGYTYSDPANPLLNISATAYDNDGSLTLYNTSNDGGTDKKAWWLSRGGDLRNRMDMDPFTLTYGIDYSWEKSIGQNSSTRVSESAKNTGLYVQGDYDILPQWSVSAGGRYDMAELEDSRGYTHDNSHFSPNIRTDYQINSHIGTFLSWSEAFRGPRPIQGTTLLNGTIASADTDVEGEVADTTKAGVTARWQGWNGSITGYRTKIRHAITYNGRQGNPFDRENGASIRIKGFDIGVGYGQPTWNAKLTYSHSDMKYGDRAAQPGDFRLGGSFASPQGDRFILNLGYQIPSWDLALTWTSTVAMDLNDVPSGYPEIPGYDVHDASVTWQPSERYKVTLAMLNIFDERYMDQTSPYYLSSSVGTYTNLYDMGRDIRLTGTIKF